MTGKEQFEVMRAFYEHGELIQRKNKNFGDDQPWMATVPNVWEFDVYNYRVAPKTIYVALPNGFHVLPGDLKVITGTKGLRKFLKVRRRNNDQDFAIARVMDDEELGKIVK